MKHLLLSATSILATATLAVPAFASEAPAKPQSTWYTSISGGANWADVATFPGVSEDTGLVVAGAVGKTVPAVPGLRIEAEVSFRSEEVTAGPFSIDHDMTSLLFNAAWDVPVKLGPVQPYVLAGVGVAQHRATFENIPLVRVESTGLAWQLGAGLDVDLDAEGEIKAGVSYRYFQGTELEVLSTQLSDGSNHALMASLRFAL